MLAESICKELKIKLNNNNNFKGKIHSVFQNAVNIITNDNSFITILTNDKPIAPYAIRIFDVTSFLEYKLENNMKISFHNDCICLDDLSTAINWNTAYLWDPKPTFLYEKSKKEDILIKLSIMEKYLVNSKSILPNLLSMLTKQYKCFNSFSYKSYDTYDFINERFIRFMKSFIEEEEFITDFSKGIIGYGLGLTPSIDDYICGLMISKIYLTSYLDKNIEDSLKFNSLIIKDIEGRTTRVSEEMLKFSAKGYVSENIRSLIISLISNSSLDDFEINLKKVADFGFTSGADIISGIYTCSSLLFNHIGGRYGERKIQHKKEHIL